MDDNLAKDLENAAKTMNAAAGAAPAAGDELTAASSSSETTPTGSNLEANDAATESPTNNVSIAPAASIETPAAEPAAGVFSEPKVEADSLTSSTTVAPITSAPTANAPWNTPTQQSATQNAAGAQPKKKSKKGLIIGCTIGGVVVAACAGFGIAYAVAENLKMSHFLRFRIY